MLKNLKIDRDVKVFFVISLILKSLRIFLVIRFLTLLLFSTIILKILKNFIEES